MLALARRDEGAPVGGVPATERRVGVLGAFEEDSFGGLGLERFPEPDEGVVDGEGRETDRRLGVTDVAVVGAGEGLDVCEISSTGTWQGVDGLTPHVAGS